MRSRLDLHEKLVEILGSRNVYFQPPATVKMQYPCIIYKRNVMDAAYANNSKYSKIFVVLIHQLMLLIICITMFLPFIGKYFRNRRTYING